MRLVLLALGCALGFATAAAASDYAGAISAYRRVGVAYVDNQKSPYRKFWAMVITD